MEAPAEKLAYVALLNPAGERPDAIGVVDVDPTSPTYGRSSARPTCPARRRAAPLRLERVQLAPVRLRAPPAHGAALPGGAGHPHIAHCDLRHEAGPAAAGAGQGHRGETIADRTGYTTPHTTHCGPDGIYVNALGGVDGNGPGGVFMLDHETFDVKGPWEKDRGPQYLSYDFGWHLGHDTMITSEWGTPNMVKDGLNPELLLAGKYGHALHVWDLKQAASTSRRLDLGEKQQMVLELRPAHDPRRRTASPAS
jgi:methanethiol oxidase